MAERSLVHVIIDLQFVRVRKMTHVVGEFDGVVQTTWRTRLPPAAIRCDAMSWRSSLSVSTAANSWASTRARSSTSVGTSSSGLRVATTQRYGTTMPVAQPFGGRVGPVDDPETGIRDARQTLTPVRIVPTEKEAGSRVRPSGNSPIGTCPVGPAG